MNYHEHDFHGMAGFHLVGLMVLALLLVIPFWRMLPRAGIPGWLALFAAFPPGALILLWIVAFREEATSKGKE
jgi:hypothetical protein